VCADHHLLARALGMPPPELDPAFLPELPALRRTYLRHD